MLKPFHADAGTPRFESESDAILKMYEAIVQTYLAHMLRKLEDFESDDITNALANIVKYRADMYAGAQELVEIHEEVVTASMGLRRRTDPFGIKSRVREEVKAQMRSDSGFYDGEG